MINELYDEQTGIEPADEPLEIAENDVRALRATMIRTEQLGRELEKVKSIEKAVVDSYRDQRDRIENEIARLRSSLQAYVERHGTVKFPDVGTAYLAAGDPKITVEDSDAFKAATGAMFTKEMFDETAAKRFALEQALNEGEIIAGTSLTPGGPRLQIRKA